MKFNRYTILFFFTLFLTLFLNINTLNAKDFKNIDIQELTNDSSEYLDFKSLSDLINQTYFPNIKSHIENFSSFGSRMTGYPGYNQSIAYIIDYFHMNNLSDITNVSYPLTIPIESETFIQYAGQNFTAHSLLPNSVHTCNTPLGGLTGVLTYAGYGNLMEFDGLTIKDSIVVLEFNSGSNWINVASLGAKGVIFLPPNDTDRFEAKDKVIDIPLNFPRVYISNSTTAGLIRSVSQELGQSITIFNRMEWRTIEAKSIVGYIQGLSDDKIIISAHFDSTSIIPSLAPGADDACGIATLLELIRVIKENDITPQKTLMFLALSGHHQSAAGAREFVHQNYADLNKNSGIKLFLSLDLSATNNKIGINPYGYLYRFKLQFTSGNNLQNRMKDIGEGYLEKYTPIIQTETGENFETKSFINLQRFENIAPITFVGDQEPFVASNVIGLSLFTTESFRIKFNTPFDITSNLNWAFLKSQVVYTICALSQLVTEQNLDHYLDLQHKSFSLKTQFHVGFAYIQGYVKEHNETTAWLVNVPNALIRVSGMELRKGVPEEYVYYTKADENGFYQIRGLASSQPDYPLDFTVEAYNFDNNGNMVKAINLGQQGQQFKRTGKLTNYRITVNPTVFDCGTISLFGINHPYTQKEEANLLRIKVLDPETRSIHFSFGYIGIKTISLVFIQPNKPGILVGEFPDKILGVYATNSSQERLQGNGFIVEIGESKNLGMAAYISSRDLQSMTQKYINLYTSYNIDDNLVNESINLALKLYNQSIDLLNLKNYSNSTILIKQAFTWAYDAFRQARNVIEDGTSTTIFFAVLLIPFSFAVASLLFNFDTGLKRIISTSIIYGIVLGFFYIIHPGLHLSKNIVMIILGVVAIIFIFPALYMIYQEGYNFLKGLRIKIAGTHFVDTSRTSTILIAMSTGISRMKKRKGRTIIALSGIILITYSLTLFTSASTQITVYSRGIETPTPYTGVYLRHKDWTSPLAIELYESLKIEYQNLMEFTTRWWMYPPTDSTNGYVNVSAIESGITWFGLAILGLTEKEIYFQPVEDTLIAGHWLSGKNKSECILPDSAAEELNIDVNETIFWAGSIYTVVGIISGDQFDEIRDFDSEAITPRNTHASSPNVHISANQIMILSAEATKDIGASLYSISILTEYDSAVSIAETITSTYARYIEVRVGNNNIVSIHKRAIQDLGRGFVELAVPLIIAILLMINTSISTVYESRKEIAIFTSLGLAPFHIAGLFLAEFLVYAVIGSVIGYLAGITSAVILSAIGLFPETLAINYSSGSVVNALGFGILGILLSTIYPLRISAKMSVPSVKRAWELTTRPEEDEISWKIPLPFVAATEKEAEGIIEFLREYFVIYESESVGGVFFAQNIRISEKRTDRIEKHLTATVNLAPFDMGLKQTVDIYTYLDEVKYHYIFEIDLVRLDGILSAWQTSVRRFVDSLRKQLLIWRSLSKDEKSLKTLKFRENIS
ncbi:MAG: M28 family peptidase [Candidatus Hodarchaeota archaeon]